MKTLQNEVHLLSKPHDNLNILVQWSTLQFHPQTQKIKKGMLTLASTLKLLFSEFVKNTVVKKFSFQDTNVCCHLALANFCCHLALATLNHMTIS